MFAFLCLYWCFRLPSSGNAVLALSVAAVLMTISEINARLKAVWLILVFFLAFIEHRVIEQDRDKSNRITSHLVESTDYLVDDTKALVTTMHNTLIEFQSLSSKVSGMNDHLANLDRKIMEAQTRKDSKAVMDLQAQKKATLTTLISITPNVIRDILLTSQACRSEDAELTELLREQNKEQMGPPRGKVREVCKEKLIPQAKSADSIREALLREIPPSQQTEADKTYTLTFARVTTNAFSPDAAIRMREATDYLRDLAKRVAQK